MNTMVTIPANHVCISAFEYADLKVHAAKTDGRLSGKISELSKEIAELTAENGELAKELREAEDAAIDAEVVASRLRAEKYLLITYLEGKNLASDYERWKFIRSRKSSQQETEEEEFNRPYDPGTTTTQEPEQPHAVPETP